MRRQPVFPECNILLFVLQEQSLRGIMLSHLIRHARRECYGKFRNSDKRSIESAPSCLREAIPVVATFAANGSAGVITAQALVRSEYCGWRRTKGPQFLQRQCCDTRIQRSPIDSAHPEETSPYWNSPWLAMRLVCRAGFDRQGRRPSSPFRAKPSNGRTSAERRGLDH